MFRRRRWQAAVAVMATAVTAGLCARAIPSAATEVTCAAGTDVRTTAGPVCGFVDDGVSEWLGIPYAAPPTGALRWRPPRPHPPWTRTLAATAFGSACLHPADARAGIVSGGSENCLFLNVWRPARGTDLPVMVHIHGGGFLLGSGDGDNTLLARSGHDVIVSMNYRLGIFGFLAGRALGPHSGDYGLQDQQAALRWVQQNITRFGGDPRDVTIFGESAGGSSVCDQIASPAAAGLFARAISTSGEYGSLDGVAAGYLENQDCKASLPSQAEADRAGARFAAAAGCAMAAITAACLRRIPAARALTAAGLGYQLGGTGTIAPTINAVTLPVTLRHALLTGRANRVPVIAGVDRDENLIGAPVTPGQFRRLVRAQYGRYAGQVLRLYPLSRFGSPFLAWRTIAADSDDVCQAIATDRDLARWMPVYGYEIDWAGAPSPDPGGRPDGAYHVAGWYLDPEPGLGPDARVLQDQEVADVTAFARTGDPSAAGTPLWPEFNSSGEVMSLNVGGDSQVETSGQIALDHRCGFWDQIAPRP